MGLHPHVKEFIVRAFTIAKRKVIIGFHRKNRLHLLLVQNYGHIFKFHNVSKIGNSLFIKVRFELINVSTQVYFTIHYKKPDFLNGTSLTV